jgi:hypothetical protein
MEGLLIENMNLLHHMEHVSGTIGAGILDPRAKGMAPRSANGWNFNTQSNGPVYSERDLAATNDGVELQILTECFINRL